MAFFRMNEGAKKIEEAGLPATVTFDLSTKTATEIGVAGTFAGGYGVATGTGYAAKTQALPTPSSAGVVSFTQLVWETGVNTNWPAEVKSLVARNGSTNLICAWDLEAIRKMNAANTTEKVTPTYTQ